MENTAPNVIIISPTIGSPDLADAMNSVRTQTYPNLLHLIVIDGPQHERSALDVIASVPPYNYQILLMPWNTGANRFNGHRIFAALGFLVNEKYVMFLDDDNWIENNHVSSLVDCLESASLDWAFSLRKIFSSNKEFICADNCESIGNWQPFSRMAYLVDTSCYCLKTEVLMKAGYSWMTPYTGDRTFFSTVSRLYPNFQSTGLYTLNYKISDEYPPDKNFFLKGNEYMAVKYSNNLPWSPRL